MGHVSTTTNPIDLMQRRTNGTLHPCELDDADRCTATAGSRPLVAAPGERSTARPDDHLQQTDRLLLERDASDRSDGARWADLRERYPSDPDSGLGHLFIG
jgi:hypothetical protein